VRELLPGENLSVCEYRQISCWFVMLIWAMSDPRKATVGSWIGEFRFVPGVCLCWMIIIGRSRPGLFLRCLIS